MPFILLFRGKWRLHLWLIWSLYWKITLILHTVKGRGLQTAQFMYTQTQFSLSSVCRTLYLSLRMYTTVWYFYPIGTCAAWIALPSCSKHYIFVRTSYMFLQHLSPLITIPLQWVAITAWCWKPFFQIYLINILYLFLYTWHLLRVF